MRYLSLSSVASSMRTMTRFMRKNVYKAKNNKEEPVVLPSVRPLSEEHRANPPPQTTAPKKGGAKTIGQKVRDAIYRTCPCLQPEILKDDFYGLDGERRNQSRVLSIEKMNCHRMIGGGRYGTVHLGSHPAIDQKLAVKIIKKKKLRKNEDHWKTVSTELGVLEKVGQSPYITHMYGMLQTKHEIVVVMERLSREDLFDNMVPGPLPDDTIRYFIAEMICALRYLRSKEIVHRNIKPKNILLSDDGHIKITGFGLAVAGVTESKRIKGQAGSLTFRAPEVHRGLKYFGMVDYFALGVIVYVMAFGWHPFLRGGEPTMKITGKVLGKKPRFPEGVNPALRSIIEILLCKNQDERMMLARGIRGHPFLRNVDWKETKQGNSPPPFPSGNVPEEDLSAGIPGDKFLQSEEHHESPIEPEEQKKFHGQDPHRSASSPPLESQDPHHRASSSPLESQGPHSMASSPPSESQDPHSMASSPPLESQDPHSRASSPQSESQDLHRRASSSSSESRDPHRTASSSPSESKDPHRTASSSPSESQDPHSMASSPPSESQDPHCSASSPPSESQDPHRSASSPPSESQDPHHRASSSPLESQDPHSMASSPPSESQDPHCRASSPPSESQGPHSMASSPPSESQDPHSMASSPPLESQDPHSRASSPQSESQDPHRRASSSSSSESNDPHHTASSPPPTYSFTIAMEEPGSLQWSLITSIEEPESPHWSLSITFE
ncbi:atypical protein kinase C-like isoform X1 [Rana temporaria]|uniref:atypical protein kinase C-like isoform X1 n=2 Tax=Rana temporaria TaxID=8407 RepID=UPI001AAE0BAC|nr:atypical protein kinase C-like isoform X1 [Rana temporaria]